MSNKPGRVFFNYDPQLLDLAIKEVQKRAKLKPTARKFKIPSTTLFRRVKGVQPKSIGRPPVLSKVEEETLAKYLKFVAEWGNPLGILETRLVVRNYLNSMDRQVPQFGFENTPGKFY